MAEQVTFTIDGREVTAAKGEYLLAVALRNGIHIPHLCYNPELSLHANCRVCLTEIRKGSRVRLVAACIYPVEQGLAAFTDTERVTSTRRTMLELLLAGHPNSADVRALAARYGITGTPFEPDRARGNCILCGMCIRTCEEVVGVAALGFIGRGHDKRVGTPYDEPSKACIGCGACAYICPTGCIHYAEQDGVRTIWKKEFAMLACTSCGRRFMPDAQLAWLAERYGVSREKALVCPDCRKV